MFVVDSEIYKPYCSGQRRALNANQTEIESVNQLTMFLFNEMKRRMLHLAKAIRTISLLICKRRKRIRCHAVV